MPEAPAPRASRGSRACGARAPQAAAAQELAPKTNVLLIVLDGLRADFVGAYDDPDDRADTPNLDALADESLRFEHAIPEAMAAMPARKAIVTGMRSFPFRDWRPVEGMARFPGWTQVYDHQPVITDVLTDEGVEAIYIADNPLLEADRFSDVYRAPEGRAPQNTQAERWVAPVVPGGVSGEDRSIKRVVDGGIAALGELKGKSPFFLAVDAFDPAEASEPTPVFLRPSDALEQRERSEERERETADKVRFGRAQRVSTEVSDERVRDSYARGGDGRRRRDRPAAGRAGPPGPQGHHDGVPRERRHHGAGRARRVRHRRRRRARGGLQGGLHDPRPRWPAGRRARELLRLHSRCGAHRSCPTSD